MTDIFREVEEDVRRERLEKFWKAYGSHVIALMVVIFAGIGGYEYWQRHEADAQAQASVRFMAAQRIASARDAAKAFDELSTTAPSGYALLARLSEANKHLAMGQTADALARYKAIAGDDKKEIGAVARLRAGWMMAETTPRADLLVWLQPVNDPASAWRQMSQEILAYADFHAGDRMAAIAKYTQLASDIQAPDALRARARAMAALLSEGNIKDFGSVPPPAPAAPIATPEAAPAQ